MSGNVSENDSVLVVVEDMGRATFEADVYKPRMRIWNSDKGSLGRNRPLDMNCIHRKQGMIYHLSPETAQQQYEILEGSIRKLLPNGIGSESLVSKVVASNYIWEVDEPLVGSVRNMTVLKELRFLPSAKVWVIGTPDYGTTDS
ncbi:hypothetical protein M404DRAFT_1001316 [Pisolithus tinctorius Marx 270]|uniref:Uncharacterized protein n=1 Tax=Pisolithus tinctorius Marx 270 TaxID=870435 RepID=A0A0C3J2W6_PISTI|nr:hypothetical protein M404DRAFT_1001316 [Pisolithus tinctorius Marx 270]